MPNPGVVGLNSCYECGNNIPEWLHFCDECGRKFKRRIKTDIYSALAVITKFRKKKGLAHFKG